MGDTVPRGVDLSCSSVEERRGNDAVVAGGADSYSGGVGVGGTVVPGVDLACS